MFGNTRRIEALASKLGLKFQKSNGSGELICVPRNTITTWLGYEIKKFIGKIEPRLEERIQSERSARRRETDSLQKQIMGLQERERLLTDYLKIEYFEEEVPAPIINNFTITQKSYRKIKKSKKK